MHSQSRSGTLRLRSMKRSVLLLTLLSAVLTGCAGSKGAVSRGAGELSRFVMPVRGIQPYELTPNFGAARDNGARKHEGLDIMAPMGREVLACVSGKILTKKWNDLGGNTIWLQGDDGKVYYFAHLSAYREGISDGERVRAADVIGFVGNTGDAQGKSPHLHFEVHDTRGGPAYDPFPILTQDGILVMSIPVTPLPKKKK